MVILYGIKNCDTVKKARNWLNEHEITYCFHDFRIDGLSLAQIQDFADRLGWEALVNRNSSSWRQLSEPQRARLNETSALQLLLDIPTLIKRPVLVANNQIVIGFKADRYATVFALKT